MHTLVFDIETIPDTKGGRHLLDLPDDLSEQDVGEAMQHLSRQKKGNDFLPLHLHRIVAISAVLASSSQIKVWSLGERDDSEAEIIQRFYAGIEKYTPTLVSWNGSGFDLPVLHYRTLFHGISAPRYWEIGEEERSFRWNNYINRYHYRHLDLMDIISAYQMRAAAPLDQIASLMGFPGKMGMSGDKVWGCYLDRGIDQIRQYCETDVLNTYLVYLRFELMRGQITLSRFEEMTEILRNFLKESSEEHLQLFLQRWHESSKSAYLPSGLSS